MSKSYEDWFPSIKLRVGETSWNDHDIQSKGVVLEADLDTGVPGLFLSEEVLKGCGIERGIFSFTQDAIISGEVFRYYTKKFKVVLIGEMSESPAIDIPCHVVENFQYSPLTRVNPNRQALAGRSVLKWFNAIVEVNAPNNETHVLLQDWQSFEKEVANLYRALSVKVHRNVNLAGNQIDVLLEEDTSSGKSLRTIVECKFYQKLVGIQEIRELAAVFEFIRSIGEAEHAVLVSSSGFTKDAHLVAKAAGIELLEIEDLKSRVTSKKKILPKPEITKPELVPERKPIKSNKTAFVIMPFGDEFRDIYMLGIRETLAKHNYVCLRADEMQFSGRIMDKILDSIKGSDFIIAEVTEHNPNVYYELGIAHAFGKIVVICTKDVSSTPFDIKDLNHIVYRDIVDLREKLTRRLDSFIQMNEIS